MDSDGRAPEKRVRRVAVRYTPPDAALKVSKRLAGKAGAIMMQKLGDPPRFGKRQKMSKEMQDAVEQVDADAAATAAAVCVTVYP